MPPSVTSLVMALICKSQPISLINQDQRGTSFSLMRNRGYLLLGWPPAWTVSGLLDPESAPARRRNLPVDGLAGVRRVAAAALFTVFRRAAHRYPHWSPSFGAGGLCPGRIIPSRTPTQKLLAVSILINTSTLRPMIADFGRVFDALRSRRNGTAKMLRSILVLRRLMCVSTMFVFRSKWNSHTCSSSIFRVTTRPSPRSKNSTSRNSRGCLRRKNWSGQCRLPEIAHFGRPGWRVRTIAVLPPRCSDVLPAPWSMLALGGDRMYKLGPVRPLSRTFQPFGQRALPAQSTHWSGTSAERGGSPAAFLHLTWQGNSRLSDAAGASP